MRGYLPEIGFLFHSPPLPPYWNLPPLGQKGKQNGLTAFPLLCSSLRLELGEGLDMPSLCRSPKEGVPSILEYVEE